MVREEVLNDALTFIRTTPPLSRCGVQDVLGGENSADVRLGLATPDHLGVHDLFEKCKQTARNHDGEGYRLEPHDEHQTDESGEPYFYIRVHSTEVE